MCKSLLSSQTFCKSLLHTQLYVSVVWGWGGGYGEDACHGTSENRSQTVKQDDSKPKSL